MKNDKQIWTTIALMIVSLVAIVILACRAVKAERQVEYWKAQAEYSNETAKKAADALALSVQNTQFYETMTKAYKAQVEHDAELVEQVRKAIRDGELMLGRARSNATVLN